MNFPLMVSCGWFLLGLAPYFLCGLRFSNLSNVLKNSLVCYRSEFDFGFGDGRFGVKTTHDFATMCVFCVREEWVVVKKRIERCGTECIRDSVDSRRVNQHHMNLVHFECGLRAHAIFLNYSLHRAEGAMPSIRNFPLLASEQAVCGRVFFAFFAWRFRTKLCAHISFQLQQCHVTSVFHGGVPLPFIRAKFFVRTFAMEKTDLDHLSCVTVSAWSRSIVRLADERWLKFGFLGWTTTQDPT